MGLKAMHFPNKTGKYTSSARSGTILEPSSAIFGHLGTILGPSWRILDSFWGHLEASWEHLESILDCIFYFFLENASVQKKSKRSMCVICFYPFLGSILRSKTILLDRFLIIFWRGAFSNFFLENAIQDGPRCSQDASR